MQLRPGTYLQGDKYRIIDTLGNGGFGITYLAEHELAGRNVCIKEFFPKEFYNRDDNSHSISLGSKGSAKIMDAFKAKFIKEAKTIARLDHPNIIHIHDVFAENGTAYYVMEYVEGESLSALVRGRGALAEAEAIKYIRAVAEALDYIHERKIMHLDIKPANVMLRKVDGRAILIDFGLSKQYDEEGNQTSSTPVGISAGYAPMEQYQQGGVKEFSPETDIYSLGATLYYLVTGEVPPQAAAVVDNGLPELPAHLSSGVRNAIERSMEIQRKRRPHSIKEFLALLENRAPEVVAVPTPAPLSEETKIDVQKAVAEESTAIVTPQPKREISALAEPRVQPNRSDKEKKRSKWWLWVLIFIAIGFGGYFALIMGSKALEKEEPSQKYEIGDYYNENGKKGVVFFVSDGGRHGKILSLDETELPWCTYEQYSRRIVVGASSEDDGKYNTDKVMNRSDSREYSAFVWCRNKGNDWYLPSKGELETIYKNKSKINKTLIANSEEELKDDWYWSSTEDNEFCAWLVTMYDGYTGDGNENNYYYVRAVSAF